MEYVIHYYDENGNFTGCAWLDMKKSKPTNAELMGEAWFEAANKNIDYEHYAIIKRYSYSNKNNKTEQYMNFRFNIEYELDYTANWIDMPSTTREIRCD